MRIAALLCAAMLATACGTAGFRSDSGPQELSAACAGEGCGGNASIAVELGMLGVIVGTTLWGALADR